MKSQIADKPKQYFCLFRGDNGVSWLKGFACAFAALLVWELLAYAIPPENAAYRIIASFLLFLTASVGAAFVFSPIAGVASGLLSLYLINWRCFCYMDALMGDPLWIGIILSLLAMIMGLTIRFSQRAAKAHENFLGDLLTSLSHDIKTPLAAITGATTTLQHLWDKIEADEANQMLQTANDEAKRLERYVNNIVDMAKLHNAQIEPDFRTVTVEALLQEMLKHYPQNLADRFTLIDDNPLAMLKIDPMLMQKALKQVCDNALTYSPKDTPIVIRTLTEASTVQIIIEDQGDGFPTEWLSGCDHLLRAKLRDSSCQGTGFGLVICQSIIALHGGYLRLMHSLNEAKDNVSQAIIQLPLAKN